MKLRLIATTFVITLLLASCATSKKATQTNSSTPETSSVVNNISEIVNLAAKNQLNFKTANASSISLDVNVKNMQKTVNASCKIITDSAIYLSVVPFLGIEMFRLELTPDKFILIDKLNRTYYSESYSFFSREFGIGITYYDIQSLISNHLFTIGKDKVTTGDFSLKDNNNNSATLIYNNDKVTQESTISLAQNRITQTILKAVAYNYELETNYSNFINFDGYKFPQKMSFIIKKNGINKGYINFDIDDVKFNIPVTLKATNLSKYDKGNITYFLRK